MRNIEYRYVLFEKCDYTHAVSLESRFKLPRAVVFSAPVHEGNLCKHFFEIRLWLLRSFSEVLDRPVLSVAE